MNVQYNEECLLLLFLCVRTLAVMPIHSRLQQTFDTEVTRHIEERKTLTLELQRISSEQQLQLVKSQQELEECREEKRMMAEEKDEAIDEYKQQCTKLQEKVKIAYSEVNISFSLPLSFFSSLLPYTCTYNICVMYLNELVNLISHV